MKRFINAFGAVAAMGLMVFGVAADANAQQRNERAVRDTVRTLNSQIDDFQYGLEYQLRNSSGGRQEIAEANRSIKNLQEKVNAFDENLNQRRENRDDINEIVTAAKGVDGFLRSNPQNRRLETDWSDVKKSIDTLAANYSVTPNWGGRTSNATHGNSPDPVPSRSATSGGLTGTYTFDPARSESTADIISNSNAPDTQKADLESKLDAPEQIAIDIRGNQVTLASSKATPVTFVADGREKTEQANGRTVRLRATLRGQQLTITSLGGDTDYTVTFVSADNGRTMKVTRRITTDYLRETVFAESVYNKTDGVALLGIDAGSPDTTTTGDYSSNDPNDARTGTSPNPTMGPGRTGEFIVANGTVVTGLLETMIDTKVSQNNDRFKLTVQSPDEYRGATIEGYLSGVGRSGQVSGRSNVTFNFERITLRSGEAYDFAGYLQSIKDQNGKVVKVDTEGTAKGDSQTRETAKRGGVGAGLGAIIGAIAGGGKGAAIGAIIGGGAGAGSVIVQVRDDVKLMQGSLLTIQASSPIRKDQPVSEN